MVFSSTVTAPWTVVEGNDKLYARVKTLRTLVEALTRELRYEPTVRAAPEKGKQKRKGKKDG